LEKGRTVHHDETKVKFLLFDENKEDHAYMTELFEDVIKDDMNLLDLKNYLSDKLQKDLKMDIPVKSMRLRDFAYRSPGTIFRNDMILKQCGSLYHGKSMAIQFVAEDLVEIDQSELIFFVQQWFPSKYQLGKRIEVHFPKHTKCNELREILSKKFSIENVGLAKYYSGSEGWDGPNVIDVPNMMDWDRTTPQRVQDREEGNFNTYILNYPLNLSSGDILLFRDEKEELKKLTPKEKRELEILYQKKKGGHSKEKVLHIEHD